MSAAVAELPLVRHPGSAVSILVAEPGMVVVVYQRRAGVGIETAELPQEKLEPGESPLEAAQRGLAEECGLTGCNWSSHGDFWAVPAYSNHRVYVFSADLDQVLHHADSVSDEIGIGRLPLDDAEQNVDDAISPAALHLYRGEGCP